MRTSFMPSFARAAAACVVPVLLLLGCSAASESAEGGDSAIHVHPNDTETWSHLTVQLPAARCEPGGACSAPLGAAVGATIDGVAVALGASSRLKPGAHTLIVNGAASTITTSPGQDRTVVLPTAHRRCAPAPLPDIPRTDFGGPAYVTNAPCPDSLRATAPGATVVPTVGLYAGADCSGGPLATLTPSIDCAQVPQTTPVYGETVDGACRAMPSFGEQTYYYPDQLCFFYQEALTFPAHWSDFGVPAQSVATGVAALADADLAYAPGSYAATVNGVDTTVTLSEGDTAEIALPLPVVGAVPATFATTISFADPRANPDAAAGTITSTCNADAPYTIPPASTATLALQAFTTPYCAYTLNVGGRQVALDQTRGNEITLHRVDVDDVTITREDGSTYVVKGQYGLYFGGVLVAGPYDTGTGIDALPGDYELDVSYTDADGPKTQKQTFTL